MTIADYADAVAGLLGALGVERPHVCGLSFGGGLAIAVYGRHPDAVRSLVLAGAYAGWKGSLPACRGRGPPASGTRRGRTAACGVDGRLHAAVPQSELVLLPGVGHEVNIAAPAQFNAEVRRFLGRVPR